MVGLLPIVVYAICLVAMLGCSAAYHLAEPSPRRELLRRVDQAMIFLMIAGTYTPFTIDRLDGDWSTLFTIGIWSLALMGAAAKLAYPRRLEGFTVALYLALGWIGLVEVRPIFAALDMPTLFLLGAGGLLYTVGTVFHLWERLPFQNAIWHGFVVSAACCHYAAVLHGVALASNGR
jgi:hemolysin III